MFEGEGTFGLTLLLGGEAMTKRALLVVSALLASCSYAHWESREMMPKLRAVLAAQAAYKEANCGFYDSKLECLEAPWNCIPNYPKEGPRFITAAEHPFSGRLEGRFRLPEGNFRPLTSETWNLKLVAGPPATVPNYCSRSSVVSFSYTFTKTADYLGPHGLAGACGDSAGIIIRSEGSPQSGDLALVAGDGLCALDDTPAVRRSIVQ
jgi:hypothetical protein